MGVILTDSVTLANRLVCDNMYYGLVGNINLTKEYSRYVIRATFGQWASQQARDDRVSPIGMKKIELKYNEPPTGNIYDLVYEELKRVVGAVTDA